MDEATYKNVKRIAGYVASRYGRAGVSQDDLVHEFLLKCLERGRLNHTDAFIRNGVYYEAMRDRERQARFTSLPFQVPDATDYSEDAVSRLYLDAAKALVRDEGFQEVLSRRLDGQTYRTIEDAQKALRARRWRPLAWGIYIAAVLLLLISVSSFAKEIYLDPMVAQMYGTVTPPEDMDLSAQITLG